MLPSPRVFGFPSGRRPLEVTIAFSPSCSTKNIFLRNLVVETYKLIRKNKSINHFLPTILVICLGSSLDSGRGRVP